MPRTKQGVPSMQRTLLHGWDQLTPFPRSFYEHPPELVAPRLLGKLLVHRVRGKILAGRIVEVEAYLGPHNNPPDPAAHTYRGPTPRNVVLFGPPGYAYVYSIYGQYYCLNVSCEPDGVAGGILFRALEPVAGLDAMARNRGLAPDGKPSLLTSGPSRLCQALGLTRAQHNGLDFTSQGSPLQIVDDGFPVPEPHAELHTSPRIGIKHAIDWPLRFSLAGHDCVSGPRRGNGVKK
ncbi:DNA-3-methyladenine glycosylase [Terracidiphilus gabretensis]|uniref:DNA-3-methyladenine glycosylase n=1 Tax=Terracidiphilus gabretensis TaxID=1577687 RepID=UPI000AFE0D4B|nr:DNA-3-methyladenine glycosylase [Terracidiphilus gabretensis]